MIIPEQIGSPIKKARALKPFCSARGISLSECGSVAHLVERPTHATRSAQQLESASYLCKPSSPRFLGFPLSVLAPDIPQSEIAAAHSYDQAKFWAKNWEKFWTKFSGHFRASCAGQKATKISPQISLSLSLHVLSRLLWLKSQNSISASFWAWGAQQFEDLLALLCVFPSFPKDLSIMKEIPESETQAKALGDTG